jgi:ABC-type ATPase involved in cell division
MVMDDMEGSSAPPAAPAQIRGMDEKLLAERAKESSLARRDVLFNVSDLKVLYSGIPALKNVSLEIYKNYVTAFIGPSGCGKSTFIRCFNRMNDLIPTASVEGQILYHGADLYGKEVDPVEVRKRIGMVFQKPNPFPKSIYDNIAFGPRVLGWKKNLDDRVEKALRHAALWDEVKNRLKASAYSLSGGQQQRTVPRGRAGRAPHGRAGLGARPDLDHSDRGPDARAQARVHDRDRHAQHAAGGTGRRHDCVLQRRRRRGAGHSDRDPRRVRRNAHDLHEPQRQAD